MKKLTLSERLDESLKMLDNEQSYILFKTLEEVVGGLDDLSPSEIWSEASHTLRAFICHPHPTDAIQLLKEAMHERYSWFDTQGTVRQRTHEEADGTICLVLNATLYLLNDITDIDERYTLHKTAISDLIDNHPLTARFRSEAESNRLLHEGGLYLPRPCRPTLHGSEPPLQPTFDQVVKAIVCKAATRNGQTVRSRAKGHESDYAYFIDDAIFCKALDEMMEQDGGMMTDYLDGSLRNTPLNKVCPFIGRTIGMCLINNNSLQMTDVVFAFAELSTNEGTIRSCLSRASKSHSFKLLMTTFEGHLRRQLLLRTR